MVPRVGGVGKSFKGAFLYYMNDKDHHTKDLDSRGERVEWTDTLNLHTNDARQALVSMIHTAKNAEEIKKQAGERPSPVKATDTVYTYSLSWHESENKTKQEMMEAGRESLKSLGLDNRQCLVIAHNDEKYQHIHIMVNRVDPKKGLLDGKETISNDHLKLSTWADNYELQRGQNFCADRRKNNKLRVKGEFVKHKDDGYHRKIKHHAKKGFKQADFHAFDEGEKNRYDRLIKRKKEVLRVRLNDLSRRENFRGQWRDHYQEERGDQKEQFIQNKKNEQKLKDVLKNKYDMYKSTLYDQRGLTARPFNYKSGQSLQKGKDGKDYSTVPPSSFIKKRKADLAKEQDAKRQKIIDEVNDHFKDKFDELKQGRFKGKDKNIGKEFDKNKGEKTSIIKSSFNTPLDSTQASQNKTGNDNVAEKEEKSRTRNRSKERKERKVRIRSGKEPPTPQ